MPYKSKLMRKRIHEHLETKKDLNRFAVRKYLPSITWHSLDKNEKKSVCVQRDKKKYPNLDL